MQYAIAEKLEIMNNNQPQSIRIDANKARDYFLNLESIYKSGTNEQKCQLFRTYAFNEWN